MRTPSRRRVGDVAQDVAVEGQHGLAYAVVVALRLLGTDAELLQGLLADLDLADEPPCYRRSGASLA